MSSASTYFEVIGARIVEGRAFDQRDVLGARQRWWSTRALPEVVPDRSAVGQRVAFSWGIEGMQTVIGVVADIREGAFDQPTAPAMYVTVAQRASDAMSILVRTAGDPLDAAPALRTAVLAIDPNLPISQVRTSLSCPTTSRPAISATRQFLFLVASRPRSGSTA